MPNWCENSITITGDEVGQLVEAVKSDESPFSFNSIIPMPEDIRRTTSPNKILTTEEEVDAHNKKQTEDYTYAQTQEQVDVLKEKYGVTNWYDWSIKNWGTKWDITDDDATTIDYTEGDDMVWYTFDTAWCPPEAIYQHLVEQFPKLDISWHYHEPGMEMTGYLNKPSPE